MFQHYTCSQSARSLALCVFSRRRLQFHGFASNASSSKQEETTPGVILRSRPARNAPVTLENFSQQEVPVNWGNEKSGHPHLICETLYLSMDPFLRCRFNEDTGVDYTSPFQVGQPLTGGGIGHVLFSSIPGIKPGHLLLDPFDGWPWQRVAHISVPHAARLVRLPLTLSLLCPLTYTLGCIGLPGVSAYFGLLREHPPKPGDCVVVSSAAGAVGSVVGQLAKLEGCRVVGITGRPAKCQALTETLKFDAAVNYRAPDFEAQLAAAVGPNGAQLYFDNVGGPVTSAVIPHLAPGAHIVVCGQISMYDTDEPYPPPLPAASKAVAEARGITRSRFLALTYSREFPAAHRTLLTLAAQGKLIGLESRERGVWRAPHAFLDMMSGVSLGKQLVEVAAPPLSAARLAALARPALPPALRGWVAGQISLDPVR